MQGDQPNDEGAPRDSAAPRARTESTEGDPGLLNAVSGSNSEPRWWLIAATCVAIAASLSCGAYQLGRYSRQDEVDAKNRQISRVSALLKSEKSRASDLRARLRMETSRADLVAKEKVAVEAKKKKLEASLRKAKRLNTLFSELGTVDSHIAEQLSSALKYISKSWDASIEENWPLARVYAGQADDAIGFASQWDSQRAALMREIQAASN